MSNLSQAYTQHLSVKAEKRRAKYASDPEYRQAEKDRCRLKYEATKNDPRCAEMYQRNRSFALARVHRLKAAQPIPA